MTEEDEEKEIINDAYDYVDSMVPKADCMMGHSPMWFGWALRYAFIAGAKRSITKGKENVEHKL